MQLPICICKCRHYRIISFYLLIAVFSGIVTSCILLLYINLPKAAEIITGIPDEIITSAMENGASGILLFTDYETRHSFAHGTPTAFGTMPYDVEEHLMGPPYYWSDKEVHKKGFITGFSSIR